MMMIPVACSFNRKGILPIVEAKFETMMTDAETIVVHEVVEAIEKASEFKGKPYTEKPSFQNTSKLTVSFSLIFPSETDITAFMEFIKKKYNLP